jgi:hypothetical protein
VIVGGGISGACTALFLSQKGIPTVLCEKGYIAGEKSSRNWGWCRKMCRDPRELPLAIEALRLWDDMNRVTGVETGYRQSGIMYMCESQGELAKYEPWLEHAREYQIDTTILSRKEVSALMPGATHIWAGAIHTLPQLKVLLSVMRTEKLEGGPEISATGHGFGWRKRLDGGYNVSNRGGTIFDIVPDAVRLMKEFLPMRRIQSGGTTMRLGKRFIEEWGTPRTWHKPRSRKSARSIPRRAGPRQGQHPGSLPGL